MKLTEYTVHKEVENKITIKGKLGGFKSDGGTHGVTMTFQLEDNEFEDMVVKDANTKVKEALRDLIDNDPDWINSDEAAGVKKDKKDGYTESK